MDIKPLEIGKKVVLRPVHQSNGQNIAKLKGSNYKKLYAQEMYYNNYIKKENKESVLKRLGGPIQSRKNWGLYNQAWVKPRIKVGKDGLTTQTYRQKAQQRMALIRKRLQYGRVQNFQVQFRTNGKTRYPNIFHSVKGSLDDDLQQQIRLLMEDCIRSTEIDNELPLNSEDTTQLKLHERFSLYP